MLQVRTCAAKPPGADVFFGTRQQFEAAQLKRQKDLMTHFLTTVTAAEEQRLVTELQADMKQLGIIS